MELWIVNDFTGVQKGTKDNPYSVASAAEYDSLIASLLYDANNYFNRNVVLHLGDGDFYTAGTYEAGQLATKDRPRYGPGWQVLGSGHTTIHLDPTAILDSYIDGWSLRVFTTACTWQQYLWFGRDQEWIDLHPHYVWNQLSEKQLVKDLTINLNYSKLIDRWRATGNKCCLSGGLLQGHGPAYENVTVRDFGTWHNVDQDGKLVGPPAETFPLAIGGAVDIFDRNKISQLDPTQYLYDAHLSKAEAAHHTGCKFEQYNEADSNDQVSLMTICGSLGQPSVGATTGSDDPNAAWVHHLRAWSYQTYNPVGDFPNTRADRNQLQAFTIYQTKGGEIAFNGGSNMCAAVYSDFFVSSNLDVHDNDWKRVLRGATWFLSPVGVDVEHFASRGHTFRRNKVTLLPVLQGAEWNGGVILQDFAPEMHRDFGGFTVGDDNEIRLDEGAGYGFAINAVNVNGLTIGKNDFGKLQVRTINCKNVVKPLTWWQKILKFLHLIK